MGALKQRVERTLSRCARLAHQGRHKEVLAEVDALAPSVIDRPVLEARILLWKAQALLALGVAEEALATATRSWEMEMSPHACHLMASAHNFLGRPDRSEKLLRDGIAVFVDSVHLPLQLAMMYAEQGRVPEALETLEDVPAGGDLSEDLHVFLIGFHADLLAASGRWREADALLTDGLDDHPGSGLLTKARREFGRAKERILAERRLARSWAASLHSLEGSAAEVDEEIAHVVGTAELPELVGVAARRLWRAFQAAHGARPQVPRAWAAGLLGAVLDLDGPRTPSTWLARCGGVKVSTVRSVRRRMRAYLATVDTELALRSFATRSNPRLSDPQSDVDARDDATVVRFPDP